MNIKKQTINKIIKYYNTSSVFFNYWKKFLAILIVPIIAVTSLVLVLYNKNLHEQHSASSMQFFNSVSNTVDTMVLYETEKFFTNSLLDPGLQIMTNTDDVTQLNTYSKKVLNDYISSLGLYINSVPGVIDNIQIHFFRPGYVLSAKNGNGYEENFADEPWYNIKSTDYRTYIPGKSTESFYISYNLYADNKICGKFVFTISLQFPETNRFNETITTYDIMLTNKSGDVLFTTNPKSDIDLYCDKISDKATIRNKRNYNYISQKIDQVNIYSAVKYDDSYHSGFIVLCIFVIIMAILLSAVIAFFVSMISYKSISRIMNELNDISVADEEFKGEAEHEINYIIENISKIKLRNTTMEQELIMNFTSLKNLQLEILQMQLTPHFLFNALNNLNFMIMSINGLDNPASRNILRICDMMSDLLDNTKLTTNLATEIEVCQNYIEIQRTAYKDCFDIIWNTDNSLMNHMVPKYILQPAIENAFKHGIRGMACDNKLIIEIDIFTNKNNLMLKVTNNAESINYDDISEIQKLLTTDVMPSKSRIGLLNLNKRIKLIYGDKYGCSIYTQNDNIITKVSIPLDKNNI